MAPSEVTCARSHVPRVRIALSTWFPDTVEEAPDPRRYGPNREPPHTPGKGQGKTFRDCTPLGKGNSTRLPRPIGVPTGRAECRTQEGIFVKKTISTIAALAMAATGAMYAARAAEAPPTRRRPRRPPASPSRAPASARGSPADRSLPVPTPAPSRPSAAPTWPASPSGTSSPRRSCPARPGPRRSPPLATASAAARPPPSPQPRRPGRARREWAGPAPDHRDQLGVEGVPRQGGFDALTETTIGGITFNPTGQARRTSPSRRRASPSTSPASPRSRSATTASAQTPHGPSPAATASSSTCIPSGNQVRIAHTEARIERGVKSGLMSGQSMGARSSLARWGRPARQDPALGDALPRHRR